MTLNLRAGEGLQGTLDALANCTNLTSVNVAGCDGVYDRALMKRVGGLTGVCQLEALTAETINNLNPLTPLPIPRLFRPAGTLDALANCTALTDLNLYCCLKLSGQSYACSASLSLTCTANRRKRTFEF